MKKSFKVLNIKCAGCANTVKKELSKKFDEIEVDLEKMPRIVTVDIQNDEDEEFLKLALRKLGYPLEGDNLSKFESAEAKAKSFISCAIGKIS